MKLRSTKASISAIRCAVGGGIALLAGLTLSTSVTCGDSPYCELPECGYNQKLCTVYGEPICVDKTNPNWGCAADQCAPCMLPNAKPTCQDGGCTISDAPCDDGYQNCDGIPGNGCEVHLRDDDKNCGACGKDCGKAYPDTTHGIAGCVLGECRIVYCPGMVEDCNGDPADGCEVDCQAPPAGVTTECTAACASKMATAKARP